MHHVPVRHYPASKQLSLLFAILFGIGLLFVPTFSHLAAANQANNNLNHDIGDIAHLSLQQNTTITEVVKLTASDAAVDGFFGFDVAVSGDTLVIGAYRDAVFETAAGAVYIFERDQGGANQWGEVLKLTPQDLEGGDWFGHSVSIDGDTLVVGAPLSDDDGVKSGSAYVFARNQGGANQWGEVVKLTASNAVERDEFGFDVAVSGDTVAISAHFSDNLGSKSGSVYLFDRNEGGADQWGETKLIVPDSGAEEDRFGNAVALSQDTLVVGSPFHDDIKTNIGTAYVYERHQGGTNQWGELLQLSATEIETGDIFGEDVAIDGDSIVVGARSQDSIIDGGAGTAYIFDRDMGGVNQWGLVQKIYASDGDQGDWYSDQLAIYGDRVVIGSHKNDDVGNATGSAYLYERNHGGVNEWGEVTKFLPSDASESDHFGFAVAVTDEFILIGAPETDENGIYSGSAYLFGITPAPTTEIAVIGNGQLIANGDTTPSIDDGTDFGMLHISSDTVTHTFTIENSGNLELNLTGTPDKVTLSGSDANDFAIIIQPTSPVISDGGTTSFVIAFTPSAVGMRTATLSIPNDDSNENPYEFTIQGEGINPVGTITIIKSANPADDTLFDFSLVDQQPGSAAPVTFTLSDPSSASQTFINLPVGDYLISETAVPASWFLEDISCTTDDGSDSSSISVQDGEVTIDLDEGENISCTFTNHKQVTLNIVKQAVSGATGSPGFDFSGSGSIGNFNLNLGDNQSFDLFPGDYTITEINPAGWLLDNVNCDNGVSFTEISNGVTVTIAGEDTTCTITNDEVGPGSITIVNEANPADGTDFGYVFGEPGPDLISTVAGNGRYGFSGDGGLATRAEIKHSFGVSVDKMGNIYIADSANHRIRKVDANGIITTVAGTGIGGFSGDGGLATNAQLNSPRGVAVDSTGNIYIADYHNHRIRKVDDNGIISTFAGTGLYGFAGDGDLATNAQFRAPWSIAVDEEGRVYISDLNNYRIRLIDENGIINTIAGNGSRGLSNENVLATETALGTPYGLAIDESGNVYIADFYSFRFRRSRRSYYYSHVRKIDSNGIITTFAGNGLSGYSGDNGLATSARLNRPFGLAVDAVGNVYIADYYNHRVRMVNTAGIITTLAGTGRAGFNGDDLPASSAQLRYPSAVAVNTAGDVFIADQINYRIRKVAPHTDFMLDDEATQTDDVNASITFTDLAAGSYEYSEQLPLKWQLIGVVCTGGSGGFYSLNGETLSVTLNDGESIICTFSNEQS